MKTSSLYSCIRIVSTLLLIWSLIEGLINSPQTSEPPLLWCGVCLTYSTTWDRYIHHSIPPPPFSFSSCIKPLQISSNAAKKQKNLAKQWLCYFQGESFTSTGCSDESLKSFQLSQNVAAHVLTRMTTSDHISLILAAPDWLQVKLGFMKLLLPLRSATNSQALNAWRPGDILDLLKLIFFHRRLISVAVSLHFISFIMSADQMSGSVFIPANCRQSHVIDCLLRRDWQCDETSRRLTCELSARYELWFWSSAEMWWEAWILEMHGLLFRLGIHASRILVSKHSRLSTFVFSQAVDGC